jgi:hypothetical protein
MARDSIGELSSLRVEDRRRVTDCRGLIAVPATCRRPERQESTRHKDAFPVWLKGAGHRLAWHLPAAMMTGRGLVPVTVGSWFGSLDPLPHARETTASQSAPAGASPPASLSSTRPPPQDADQPCSETSLNHSPARMPLALAASQRVRLGQTRRSCVLADNPGMTPRCWTCGRFVGVCRECGARYCQRCQPMQHEHGWEPVRNHKQVRRGSLRRLLGGRLRP